MIFPKPKLSHKAKLFTLFVAAGLLLIAPQAFGQDYPEDDRYNQDDRQESQEPTPPGQTSNQSNTPSRGGRGNQGWFDWEKTFVGGTFGAQFGNIIFVEISPNFGYYFTERLVGGIGATYMFLKDKRLVEEPKMHIYGGSIFGRYYVYQDFFAHTEYELLHQELILDNPVSTRTQERDGANQPSFLIGGGYSQRFGGGRHALNITLLFNLLEDENSLQENPIVRVGVSFGL